MTKHIITIILLNIFCACTNSFSQTTEIPKEPIVSDTNEVYVQVEEMPEFPGGYERLMKYLQMNIVYPSKEKQKGISGTVYVQFVINKQGKVKDVKVLRGVKNGSGLDAEAMRVISNMPNWSIGKQNGVPVNVQLVHPVKFVMM